MSTIQELGTFVAREAAAAGDKPVPRTANDGPVAA
jgi:hypothetical protein